jgi:glycosyltransferase involved in cell wall biosynthesis
MNNTIKPNIIGIIPCLNEEKFIGDVVARAEKYLSKIIVIDDGSTDSTSRIAEAAGATIIKHEKPRGAGAATRTGFNEALKLGADIVITLDGDAQHNPDEIPRLIQAIVNSGADLVIGSRFINPETNIKLHRRFGISVITYSYNFGRKRGFSDAQSCFRAYSKNYLNRIKITEDNFGFSIETLVKARKLNLNIIEVPISCIYHPGAHTLNPVIHGIMVCWNVLKWRFKVEILNSKI